MIVTSVFVVKNVKRLRDLKVHQRSCRAITSLNNDNIVIDKMEQDAIGNHFVTTNRKQDEYPSLKESIKLPKSPEDWRLANHYFHSELSSINIKNNLNEAMSLINSTVYNYFRDNYWLQKHNIGRRNRFEREIYKHFSKKDLKKELKTLKLNNASVNIIKYVAKEIRSRINKNPISIPVATDNDDKISRNFWGYAKKIFRSDSSVLPSFDVVQGTTYFTNALKCVNRMKMFTIPSWIPKLKESNIPSNLSPPTYQEITRIIKRMKFPGSSCPLDQISIICFKPCPHLRSFILNICTEVLRSNILPAQRTKAAIILIHKKGDPSLPENFRPFTLELVSLKIFTSLLQNRVFTYLINNQCIESHYQAFINDSHHRSFKKTTTECNYYLNRPKKRFWRSSPLINSICSTLSLHTR